MKKKVARLLLLVLMLSAILPTLGCTTGEQGYVIVQTIRGSFAKIIRPNDGVTWTLFTVGDDYHQIDTKSYTFEVNVQGTTSDNSAVGIKLQLTVHPKSDNDSIRALVNKWGLDNAHIHQKAVELMSGQANTYSKNAVNEHNAYGVLAAQEEVQKKIQDALTPIFASQAFHELESVQIIGKPDLPDNIENAAADVVASQKLKEGAQARLEAAQIEQQRKQLEAQVFKTSPEAYRLEQLRLQKEIAEAWAKHQGTLILGGANVTSTIPVQ